MCVLPKGRLLAQALQLLSLGHIPLPSGTPLGAAVAEWQGRVVIRKWESDCFFPNSVQQTMVMNGMI